MGISLHRAGIIDTAQPLMITLKIVTIQEKIKTVLSQNNKYHISNLVNKNVFLNIKSLAIELQIDIMQT